MQESEGVLCMRVSFRIALAGQVIGVSALYEQTRTFCKNYLTDAPASFEVAVTPADIAFEREKNDREAAVEGHAPGNFSDEYLETLALYRKIVERLLEWDTLLFHGSCISVDSKAYLFTAKSGTGKSTHTQLWKKWFGERAVFINDDKPLLKISAQGVTVYGTPWDGKHHRSTNTSCPLKAVCILTRNTENSIQRIDKKAAYTVKEYNKSNHDEYEKPPIYNFEMHVSLFPGTYKERTEQYENAKERLLPVDGTAYQFAFTPEDFYVFVLAHAHKHYSHSGTGIRTLADIYVMDRHLGGIMDRDEVEQKLTQLGIAECPCFFAASILHRRSNVLELFSGFIDLSKCRIGSSRLVL